MPDFTPKLRADVPRYGLALLIGGVCGWIASLLGMPLPWMLGPMIGNTVAALVKTPVLGPAKLRPVVVPVIGVMLGSGFYPGLFSQLGTWLVALIGLAVYVVVAGALGYAFYRRVGGYDPVTAYYSAMPGGFNEMILLGEEAGGNGRRIAMAHSSRILVVITLVALFYGLVLGITSNGSGPAPVRISDLSLFDAAVLIGCGLLGWRMGGPLRLPAAGLLGPMILSAIVHATGLVTVPPPTLLVIVAQVVIGTTIGCRFVGAAPREVARDIGLSVGVCVLMIGAAVAGSEAVALLTPMRIDQVFLAFSPGGLAEMSLLAVALGQDVAFVALAHLSRIVMVIAAAPFAFRLARIKRDTG